MRGWQDRKGQGIWTSGRKRKRRALEREREKGKDRGTWAWGRNRERREMGEKKGKDMRSMSRRKE